MPVLSMSIYKEGGIMLEGYIHSIETLGTRDGPGIRFVIFMQGCPLRCKYCHNPDTWNLRDGKKTTIAGLMEKINKCRPYITRSNGGVTISGGEPVLQLDFTLELLKKCHEEGFHTALDTSGYVDRDRFREMLKYVDLVLLDIKHIDDEKHRELTGVSNHKTLQTLELLEEEGKPYWVRHVIVPGYTDDKDSLNRLASFLQGKKSLEKVELLPYHNLGEYKWRELGIYYELQGIEPPTEREMQEIEGIFKVYGIKTD